MKYIVLLISSPLLLFWFLFCGGLALIGVILPTTKRAIDLEQVKIKVTVCRLLTEKGYLDAEDYRFESEEVAALYDSFTFEGYLFIFQPILLLMSKSDYFDAILFYLVKHWMQTHRQLLGYQSQIHGVKVFLANVSVKIARNLGKFLYYMTPSRS